MSQPSLDNDHPYFELVQQVVGQEREVAYTVDFMLFNREDETFELELPFIEGVDIIQEFDHRAGDMIMLIGRVSKTQYSQILNYYSGLRGELSLHYTSIEADNITPTVEFFKGTFRVMLSNYSDPSKTLESEDIIETESNTGNKEPHLDLIPIHLQLIPDFLYLLPKYKFNFILRDAKVDEVFWRLVDHLASERSDGITAYLVPPHNKEVYDQIIIPPMMTIKEIVPYVQKEYGWYSKGVNFYYGLDGVYLYPVDCPEGMSETTIHFFKMPNGYLLGSRGLHLKKDDTEFVLVNRGMDISITTVEDIEKKGNSIISVPSGKLLNDWLVHEETFTSCNVDQIVSIDADIATGVDLDTHTPNFILDETNDYHQASRLAPLYINRGTTTVEGIPPFTIRPYHKCLYHFTNANDKPMVSHGTPRSVLTQLYLTETGNNHYSATTTIVLNLETAATEVVLTDYI